MGEPSVSSTPGVVLRLKFLAQVSIINTQEVGINQMRNEFKNAGVIESYRALDSLTDTISFLGTHSEDRIRTRKNLIAGDHFLWSVLSNRY